MSKEEVEIYKCIYEWIALLCANLNVKPTQEHKFINKYYKKYKLIFNKLKEQQNGKA